MVFPSWESSDHAVILVSKRDVLFHRTAYGYVCAYWDGPCDYFRNVLWKDIFKLGASAAGIEFREWVHVRIDVYIPHRKYQVKHLVLLPWLIEITSFVCTQRIDLLHLKVNSGRLEIVAKGLFEAAKLILIRQKSILLSRNLALATFNKLLTVFSANVNLLHLLHLKDLW